jgi:hypothetical protein
MFAALLGLHLVTSRNAAAEVVHDSSSLVFLGAQGDLRLGTDPLPEATRTLEEGVFGKLRTLSFKKLISPDEAKIWLGGSSTEAKNCNEAACLGGLAQALGAEQILVAQWRQAKDDLAIRIYLFRLGDTQVRREQFLVKGMSLASLKQQAGTAVGTLLDQARKTSARLVVKTNVRTARIWVNGRQLGVGEVEKTLPGGVHRVKILAEGSPPYEQEVLLGRGSERTVKVIFHQDERPALFTGSNEEFAQFPVVERTPEKPWEAPSVFKHPGLYVAAGGVALAVLGIVLGVQAKAVEGRAVDADGDGRLDVSRGEIQSARGKATWCNVLLGSGAALTVGGATWLFVAPIRPPASKLVYPALSDAGAQVGVGGTF